MKVWRFPLDDASDRLIRSVCDAAPKGGRPARSISAAQFIHGTSSTTSLGASRYCWCSLGTKDAPCIPKGSHSIPVFACLIDSGPLQGLMMSPGDGPPGWAATEISEQGNALQPRDEVHGIRIALRMRLVGLPGGASPRNADCGAMPPRPNAWPGHLVHTFPRCSRRRSRCARRHKAGLAPEPCHRGVDALACAATGPVGGSKTNLGASSSVAARMHSQ